VTATSLSKSNDFALLFPHDYGIRQYLTSDEDSNWVCYCRSFSHVTLVCESFDFIRPHLDFFPNIPESLTIHLRVPFLKELGRREGEMMDEEQLRRVLNMRKRLRLPNSPRPADRLTREEDERLLRKQELALAEELTADLRRFDPDEDYNPGGKVEEQVDKNFVVTYYELEKLEKRLESLIRTLSPWVQGGLRLLRIEMHYGPLPRCAEDIPPEDEAPRGSAEEYSLVTGAMLERNVAKVRSSFEAFVKHFIALNKRTVVFEHAFCPVDSRARFKEVDWKYDAGGDGRPKFRLSESPEKQGVPPDEADAETLYFGRKTGGKNFRDKINETSRAGGEGSRAANFAYTHTRTSTHPSHAGLSRVI